MCDGWITHALGAASKGLDCPAEGGDEGERGLEDGGGSWGWRGGCAAGRDAKEGIRSGI